MGTALVLAATILAGQQTSYRENAMNLKWEALAELTGSCLVEVVGPPTAVTCKTIVGDSSQSAVRQKVRVLDGLDISPGVIRTLVRFDSTGGGPLQDHGHYLVFGDAAKNGKLRFPFGSWIQTDKVAQWVAQTNDDVLAVQVVPSRIAKLERDTSREDTLAFSLSACLTKGTTDDTVYICEIFRNCKYPGADQRNIILAKTGQSLAHRMIDDARKSKSAYKVAKVARLLNDWHVVGSADAYFESLMDCALDPRAFGENDTYDLHSLSFWESPANLGTPGDYVHHLPDPDLWAERVLRGRNPRVQKFILENMGALKPSDVWQRRLAALLDSKDLDNRCFVAQHFASNLDMPEHSPNRTVDYLDDKYVVGYTGLDEAVAFWKAYWQR